ncbi:glycosyltransferase family 4 protein [Porticoccaceae bacterium nBUS_09]
MVKSGVFILHIPPPIHGAAMVGGQIIEWLSDSSDIESHIISMSLVSKISDLGGVSFQKVAVSIGLFVKILGTLIWKRPNFIYFTPSRAGFAFLRDLLFLLPVKMYANLTGAKVFLHFHTRGPLPDQKSPLFRFLFRFMLNRSEVITLSDSLGVEMRQYGTAASVVSCPNGVPDYNVDGFSLNPDRLASDSRSPRFLYLSNMMLEKGYREVLSYAKANPQASFEFAGAWHSKDDELYFVDFLEQHNMQNVSYLGLVSGDIKHSVFSRAEIFIFPTYYHFEAFPLCLLEALSYGLPCLSTDVGAIKEIVGDAGLVLSSVSKLHEVMPHEIEALRAPELREIARKRYLDNFTDKQFLSRFSEIINGGDS